jgi:aspartyl-tRNA(Asn)/glutamyl-tRNA(Gln) amidotransferase subunit A
MQGPDPADPVCADRPPEPVVPTFKAGTSGIRVAVASGYFRAGATPAAREAVDAIAAALDVAREIELPEAARARASAYVITAAEGAALHLERLRAQAGDFDPDVRDRLIAGTLIPAPLVLRAQKFRRWYRDAVLHCFEHIDAILAPATPIRAPLLGQKTLELDGETVPLRPNIGIYTQPISFIGLPVVVLPVPVGGGLPIGVQVIAPPWREDIALRIAYELEQRGVARAPRPPALE